MFRQATVALRPETPEDLPFLRELYLAVREEEPGFRDLDPAERRALLEQQFAWQHEQYHAVYPTAWFTIVAVDERPVGRLYLAQEPTCIRVIDLSLLPEFRGHGIGTQLMRNVQAEAMRTQLPIRLQVVADNPASDFYARLGFHAVARNDAEVRIHLEWRLGICC